MPSTRPIPRAAQLLLTEVVDYAGLFPPAALDMPGATAEYIRARSIEEAWLLGRFVLSSTRLSEWEESSLRQENKGSEAWRLSAICGSNLPLEIEAINDFNSRHTGRARVEVLELRATSAKEIEEALNLIPSGLETYVEFPIEEAPASLIERIAGLGAYAKVRTGGLSEEAIPSPELLFRFIKRCTEVEIPFKATSGLHHALRGEYRLSYEAESKRGTMFGFLNVLLATALLRSGSYTEEEALQLLTENNPASLQWSDEAVHWRSHELSSSLLVETREKGIKSFGSCSFAEPLADLRALGIL